MENLYVEFKFSGYWLLFPWLNWKSFSFNLDNAVKEILKLCPPEQLVTHYKIGSFKLGDVDDFLLKVGTVRGKLKKGGIVDINA